MVTAVCKENLTLCFTHTVSMHRLVRCWITVWRLSFISATCYVRNLEVHLPVKYPLKSQLESSSLSKHMFIIVPVFPFNLLVRVSAKNCLRTQLGLASRPRPLSSTNSCPIDVCRKLQGMFLFTGGQSSDKVTTLS